MNAIFTKSITWRLGVLLACFTAALFLLPATVFTQSKPTEPKPAATEPTADLATYQKHVKPLLERTCVECRGPEKQKGIFVVSPDS